MQFLLLRTVLLTTYLQGSYFFIKQRILSQWLVVCNSSLYHKKLWNILWNFVVLCRNSKLWEWLLILTRITCDYASDVMSFKMFPTCITINRLVVKTIICADRMSQSNLWFKVWCLIQRLDKLALCYEYFSYFCFLQGPTIILSRGIGAPEVPSYVCLRGHK